MSNTVKSDRLLSTTTGIGHTYRPNVPFITTTKLFHPLPRKLTHPCQLSVADVYGTTTGQSFDYKPGGIYPHPLYKKAPVSTKVNYTLDMAMKIDQRPSRPALTMGNQFSETHDEYRKQYLPTCINDSNESLVQQSLQDHLTNGTTKILKATDVISDLQGVDFQPHYQGVLERHEPYMTTNNWYHRRFTAQEAKKYPKKDIATYWQCEGYPKAWGFGTDTNQLSTTMSNNKTDTMRDRIVFRTHTTTPKSPKQLTPLSNWMKSASATTYANPMDAKYPIYPVMQSFHNRTLKDRSLLQTVPKMYEMESMIYGSTQMNNIHPKHNLRVVSFCP